MRELMSEFKELRLHGMAGAWEELTANGGSHDRIRWLIEHLPQAEHTDRVMRSIGYQMHAARQVHRDLAGFDFEQSKVDQADPATADLSFADEPRTSCLLAARAPNKRTLATALGVSGVPHHSKRVRFFSTVIWSMPGRWKAAGKAGRIPRVYRILCKTVRWRKLPSCPESQ